MSPRAREEQMRLNRYIARCGASSRRDADRLIESGRIAVNGVVCHEFSTRITLETDVVTLDGKALELPPLLYFKYYKPRGVITTLDDPRGRKTVAEFLARDGIADGVVPAGRLDMDSEGLLLLTNDGEMLQRLTHPAHEITKTYRVLITRWPVEGDLDKLRSGVHMGDYVAKPIGVIRMGPQPVDGDNLHEGYWLEIVMGEGRKREIREMLSAIGYRVERLVRIAHGPITTDLIKPGEIYKLTDVELAMLDDAVNS
jgi:23S rRNA pseudouridine2605 synthase